MNTHFHKVKYWCIISKTDFVRIYFYDFQVGENKIKMTLDFMMVNTEYKVIKTMANGKIII